MCFYACPFIFVFHRQKKTPEAPSPFGFFVWRRLTKILENQLTKYQSQVEVLAKVWLFFRWNFWEIKMSKSSGAVVFYTFGW